MELMPFALRTSTKGPSAVTGASVVVPMVQRPSPPGQ
jgi:hypothetical protein